MTAPVTVAKDERTFSRQHEANQDIPKNDNEGTTIGIANVDLLRERHCKCH